MKLYDLTNNYRELQMMIEDGVDPSALEDTLQAIEESIQDKAQNIALLIRNLEADTEAIKLEEKRLADRRRAVENNCKSLKDYLYQQMILLGVTIHAHQVKNKKVPQNDKNESCCYKRQKNSFWGHYKY